eukprot:1640126-Pyramimonas_sp.AAC.1
MTGGPTAGDRSASTTMSSWDLYPSYWGTYTVGTSPLYGCLISLRALPKRQYTAKPAQRRSTTSTTKQHQHVPSAWRGPLLYLTKDSLCCIITTNTRITE